MTEAMSRKSKKRKHLGFRNEPGQQQMTGWEPDEECLRPTIRELPPFLEKAEPKGDMKTWGEAYAALGGR